MTKMLMPQLTLNIQGRIAIIKEDKILFLGGVDI